MGKPVFSFPRCDVPRCPGAGGEHGPGSLALLAAACVGAAVALAGCATAPEYSRPEVRTPPAYRAGAPWKEAQPADHLPKERWWELFHDEALGSLAERVRAENQDLAAALARVEQARALVRTAGSRRLPTATLDPSAVRQGVGDDLSPSGDGQVTTVLKVPLDVSYELDLFGRVRNTVEAAESRAQASRADYENLLLTLQAEAARSYFSIRALDAEIALLEKTQELRRKNTQLVRRLYENGQVSRLDLARAEVELASARADLAFLVRQRAAREQALAVLVGQPASLFSLAPIPLEVDTEPPAVSPGLPSSLLERRPDVAAAERRMMAANADIGAAHAAFFPSVQLTGSAGFASTEIGSLFKWGNLAWSLGGLASVPILDGGKNQAARDLARGRWEEAVADYRQQVLVAFAEVEGALTDLQSLADQVAALREAAEKAHLAADLTEKRYRAGRVSYLEVVVSERTALAADVLTVRTQGLRLQASVTLIKSLGGGWEAGQVETAR